MGYVKFFLWVESLKEGETNLSLEKELKTTAEF